MHAQSLRRRAQESERQPARTARTSREEDDEATGGLSRRCSPTSPRTPRESAQKVACGSHTRSDTLADPARRLQDPLALLISPSTMSSAAKRDAFLAVWPSLATELVDYLRGEGMPKDAVDWFQRVRSLPLSVVLLPTSTKGELTPSSPRRASTTTRLAVRTALTRALRGAHADPGLCAQASSTAASRSSTRSRSSRARASPTTSTSAPPSSDGVSSWCAPSPLASVRAVGPSPETELTRSCRFWFRVRAAPGLLPRRRRHDGPEHHPPGSAVLVPRCASSSRSLSNLRHRRADEPRARARNRTASATSPSTTPSCSRPPSTTSLRSTSGKRSTTSTSSSSSTRCVPSRLSRSSSRGLR